MTIETVTRADRSQTVRPPRRNSVPGWLVESEGKSELVLIEIEPSSEGIFKQIHRSTSANDKAYQLFLQAKLLCLNDYLEQGYEYPISLLDKYDQHSVLFFSRQKNGVVNGTLRVCFDSADGLAVADSIPAQFARYRQRGLLMSEPGRFSLKRGSKLRGAFLRAIYQLAVACRIDVYLLQVRENHASYYERLFGAVSLPSDDAPPGCCNLRWDIKRTPAYFFEKLGQGQSDLKHLLSNLGELA